MNSVFDTIISRNIEIYLSMFKYDSESIFMKDKSLIHPGEYGEYRERAFKELLKCVVNSNLKIGDGFIITSEEKISSQCDVIVYNPSEVPILTNEVSNIYTVESISAIGEVKSTLSKTELKNALRKLAMNKMLGEDRIKNIKYKVRESREYEDIISFLVCKNIKCDISKIEFDDIYDNIPQKYRHNFILSLEQGVWTYQQDFSQYPEEMKIRVKNSGLNPNSKVIKEHPVNLTENFSYDCTNYFIKNRENDIYYHIKCFLGMLSSILHINTTFYTEINEYLGLHITKFL